MANTENLELIEETAKEVMPATDITSNSNNHLFLKGTITGFGIAVGTVVAVKTVKKGWTWIKGKFSKETSEQNPEEAKVIEPEK